MMEPLSESKPQNIAVVSTPVRPYKVNLPISSRCDDELEDSFLIEQIFAC